MAADQGVGTAKSASPRMWPDGAPSVQVDRFIRGVLTEEYPHPEYVFEFDKHRPRILLATRWKWLQTRYLQDHMRRVSGPKDLDLAALEKAGAGWLEIARKIVG